MTTKIFKEFGQPIISDFEKRTNLKGVVYEVKERSDGAHILIYIYHLSERFFSIINKINEELSEENPFKDHVVLKRKVEKFSLKSPEVNCLQRTLAESLTVGKESFRDEFFSRYIDSGSGAESKIQTPANHIVFGRRGAGKSSLLVYAMRSLEGDGRPYAWIDMQLYERRDDLGVIASVLLEILTQFDEKLPGEIEKNKLIKNLNSFLEGKEVDQKIDEIRKMIFHYKNLLLPIVKNHDRLVIFIDDLHVVNKNLQPLLLSILYSFSRGNKIYLKISAVQNFTKTYDPEERRGLEIPHDAQIISLDLNLTTPDTAGDHIIKILESYSVFSGVPGLGKVCSQEASFRLVWIAAGVPRDAINLFQHALTKSIQKREKRISVTSVNGASADVVEDKKRYLDSDSSKSYDDISVLFEEIKKFCINERKVNAFLVKIESSSENYKGILKLIDLRLLHVLNKSITPGTAGEKHIALLLDYGFYVGIRLAKSVGVLGNKLEALKSKDLRTLPKFRLKI